MLAVSLLLAAQVAGAPTLADVRSLRPEQAGKFLLRGKAHGRVVSAARTPDRHSIPGMVDYELVEAHQALRGGCLRRRWTARFRTPRNAPPENGTLTEAYATQEVALAGRGGCKAASYAHLNPGVNSDAALDALRTLRRIAEGTLAVTFACHSAVKGSLCATPETIRAEIRKLRVRAVASASAETELWLGPPNGLVTRVTFPSAQPRHVRVSREIPAPF